MTIEVTQEDRDRAELIYAGTDMDSHFMELLTGQLARHRQAAYEQGKVDGARPATAEYRR